MALAIHTYFALRLVCNGFLWQFFKERGRFLRVEVSFNPSDWLSLMSGNFNRGEAEIFKSNFKAL
jgi:hypothetical protein